jgi:hypothetical protein
MAAGLDPLVRDRVTNHTAEGRASRFSGLMWPGGDARRSTSKAWSLSRLHLLAHIPWLTIVGWQT